jgi:hypothetical protein
MRRRDTKTAWEQGLAAARQRALSPEEMGLPEEQENSLEKELPSDLSQKLASELPSELPNSEESALESERARNLESSVPRALPPEEANSPVRERASFLENEKTSPLSSERVREQESERASEDWVDFGTKLPRKLHRALKLHCVESGRKIQEVLAELIQDYLSRQ